MAQTVEALNWTPETARFAHRDVKPGNILLRSDGHILLTDFGSAAPLIGRRVDPSYCRTPAGTVDYMAPEILLAHQAALAAADGDMTAGEQSYGTEVDYWSLGSSMYELLYGVAPFFAPAIADTYDRIVKHEQFLRFPIADVSEEAVDLLRHWLCAAPARFGDAVAIRRHPLFSDVRWGQQTVSPAPHIPSIHLLDIEGGGEQAQPAAFDFSAFFSSPGLSILRHDDEATRPAPAVSNDWPGYTLEPTPMEMLDSAFTRATPLVMPPQPSPMAPAHLLYPFETPVPNLRRRASLLLEGQSTIRRPTSALRKSASKSRSMSEMEAWRAVVEVGAARSAQKRRPRSRAASPMVEPLSLPKARPSPPVELIEQRRQELLSSIASMERTFGSMRERLQGPV